MNEIIQYLIVIAFSCVKFGFSLPMAYLFSFNIFEMILIPLIGGILGVIIFSWFSKWSIDNWFAFSPPRNKNIFKKRNRTLVKIWRKYGLLGISFITPSLISIPVGVFIAIRYKEDKKKILIYMTASMVFWAIIFTVLLKFFGIILFKINL